jgi:predicted permease
MRWFARLSVRSRMLFHRAAVGASLDDELRFHIERLAAENRASGMPPEEARYAALRAFGNPALLREQTRATWSWNQLESLWRDLRYSLRTLRRTPGFTTVAVIVMALGIGANVALFTVVRSVLLKPLPFANPDRLLMVYESRTGEIRNSVAGGIFGEWKKYNQSFERMAIVRTGEVQFSGAAGQLPERLKGAASSWELFSTLGVHPAIGRDFTAADDSPSANGTVMLSSSLWQRRFGSDPGVLGTTVNLDTKPYTVIGVMPPWFAFPESSTELWIAAYHEVAPDTMNPYDNHMWNVVGRLKPGVTASQATADVSAISWRIHNQHLDKPFVMGHAMSRPLLEHMVGKIKQPLYILLAATACLLLIACLNVANLLVARAAARCKEMAIRTALGGGWLRLLRERLIESLLLSCVGGVAGLVFAYAIVAWLVRTRQDMARVDAIHIDTVVALFTFGVIAFCALFSGSIAAFSAGNRQTLGALREGSRTVTGSGRRALLRRALVSVEIGLTVVLLIGAGLLIRSYERLRSTDVGCITDNVLTMRIALPNARYNSPEIRANFYDILLARVRALPGVETATFDTLVPGQGYGGDWGFTIPEHPPQPIGQGSTAIMRYADSSYFAALGIPVLRGRTFDESKRLDRADEVVISQSLANTYFPGEDPIGKHLKLFEAKPEVVVGIVADTRYLIGEEPQPTQYHALRSGKCKSGTLTIRASRDIESFALPAQKIVNELDHDLSVSDVLTMNQVIGKSTLNESFNATLLLTFAVLATLLAAVGLFGVLSYVVAQRTTEIGIRMALGAQRGQVLRRVLFDGLRPALIGLACGIGAGAATVQLMRSMLYQTAPLDPAVFAVVAFALLSVAAVACAVPAWRASRLDPMQALRTE